MAINQKSQKPPEVLIRERELEKSFDMRYWLSIDLDGGLTVAV
jgi:hypothetical protein